ncbi:MAG: DNA polymerase III subunit delta [Moorellales bacterium]
MTAQGPTPGKVLARARSGRPEPAYLFYGPERHLLHLVLERLARCLPEEFRAFNYLSAEGGRRPAAELLTWAYSAPVGAPWRLLVVREEELFSGKARREDEEAYLRYLAQPPAAGCLVLVAGNAVDQGGRLYRALVQAGRAVRFERLEAGELRRWAQEEASTYAKTLRPDALAYLVAVSEGDLGFLLGAVAKACLYAGEKPEIDLAAVQEVVSATPQGTVFNLVDAVGEGDAAKALFWLRQLLDEGEPPLRLSYLLTRQVRHLLWARVLAAEGKSSAELARELSVPGFVAEKLWRQARRLDAAWLKQALEELLAVDGRLKSTGRDPRAVLEEAVWFLCRPARGLAGRSG